MNPRNGIPPGGRFVPFDAAIADISSDLRARYDIRTPDAIQVATAIYRGAQEFITNDAGMRRIREIRITMPRPAE